MTRRVQLADEGEEYVARRLVGELVEAEIPDRLADLAFHGDEDVTRQLGRLQFPWGGRTVVRKKAVEVESRAGEVLFDRVMEVRRHPTPFVDDSLEPVLCAMGAVELDSQAGDDEKSEGFWIM